MSGSKFHRRTPVVLASAGAVLALGVPLGGSAPGTPPKAGFTPAVRADAAESTSGQNEPQVTVDQTGTAFVTWQSGQNGSDVSKTRDGVNFTYLGYPDPATPNSGIGTGDIGDVTLAHTSFPNPGVDERQALCPRFAQNVVEVEIAVNLRLDRPASLHAGDHRVGDGGSGWSR